MPGLNALLPIKPIPSGVKPKGNLNKKVKCLLFDIYGTLFISRSGDIGITRELSRKNEKIQKLFLKYEINESSQKCINALYREISNAHDMLKNSGVDFPEVKIDTLWMKVLGLQNREKARRFALEYEWTVNPVYPMPNLAETLSTLKSRNIRVGMISNAQFYTPYCFKWFLKKNLKQLGFDLDLLFFSFKCSHAKPSPYMFERASEKLLKKGIHPKDVLFIGNDIQNDIFPAREIGFKTALFAGDARSLRFREDDPKYHGISPNLIITDLMQLIDSVDTIDSDDSDDSDDPDGSDDSV